MSLRFASLGVRWAAAVLLTCTTTAIAQEPADSTSPPVTRQALVTRPLNGRTVTQVEDILGRIAEGKFPVVVVRSEEPGSPWIVQATPRVFNTTYFRTQVQFGDASTALPQSYQLKVLVFDTPSAAGAWEPGLQVEALPSQIEQTETTRLFRRGPEHRLSILDRPDVIIR